MIINDYKWKLLVGLGSIAYYCPENKKPDKLHTHFWDDDDDAAADDDERDDDDDDDDA